jgi:hypothetical protein
MRAGEAQPLRGPGQAEHGGPARRRVVLLAAAAIALCGAVALAASSSSAIAARTALEYVVPGPTNYNENGAYPVASGPDPTAGLKPKAYAENGQWPEIIENPAGNLVAVQYRANGMYPEPLPRNPAEGLVPLVYKPNGAFPEEEPPNPADGLVPVAYFDNGQYRLSKVATS